MSEETKDIEETKVAGRKKDGNRADLTFSADREKGCRDSEHRIQQSDENTGAERKN